METQDLVSLLRHMGLLRHLFLCRLERRQRNRPEKVEKTPRPRQPFAQNDLPDDRVCREKYRRRHHENKGAGVLRKAAAVTPQNQRTCKRQHCGSQYGHAHVDPEVYFQHFEIIFRSQDKNTPQ